MKIGGLIKYLKSKIPRRKREKSRYGLLNRSPRKLEITKTELTKI